MEPKKSLWQRIKKIGAKIGIGILALHATTQGTYILNNAYHRLNPSPIRQRFEARFGFPVKGYASEVERNERLFHFGFAIQKEMRQLPFEIRSLTINSDNYLKKNIVDQLGRLFTTGYIGAFDPFTNSINIDHDADKSTMHHEIKHAKTYQIMRTNPELIERWKALSTDENGNSLYLNVGEQICTQLRGLEHLIDREKINSPENERLGFISSYARTNVYEDIAELCEAAEDVFLNGGNAYLFPYSKENVSERIAAKIRLAAKYGLIPSDFEEVQGRLREVHEVVWNHSFHGGSASLREDASKFMEASEQFLEKNPKSSYAAGIHYLRANIIRTNALLHKPHESIPSTMEEALSEYQKVLAAPEDFYYSLALHSLAEYSGGENAKVYEEAEKFCIERLDKKDMALLNGANDFLSAKGIPVEN